MIEFCLVLKEIRLVNNHLMFEDVNSMYEQNNILVNYYFTCLSWNKLPNLNANSFKHFMYKVRPFTVCTVTGDVWIPSMYHL